MDLRIQNNVNKILLDVSLGKEGNILSSDFYECKQMYLFRFMLKETKGFNLQKREIFITSMI